MDLNDDKLSPAERRDMREMVTGGAVRMRAARARRMQLTAGAAAFVLVAAIVTAVTWAAVRPVDRVATPVETTSAPATPTPTPTPTAPVVDPAPRSAVTPFGGSCDNVLSIDRAAEWMGAEMRRVMVPWVSPGEQLSGALNCIWAYPEAYVWGSIEVTVFPSAIFESGGMAAPVGTYGCEEKTCTAAAIVEGSWVHAAWIGSYDSEVPMRELDSSDLTALVLEIGERAQAYPAARSADATGSPWSADVCAQLAGTFPDLAGLSVEAPPSMDDVWKSPTRAWSLASTGVDYCHSYTGNGQGFGLTLVPGGAPLFDAIAASDGAQSIVVQGADRAALVVENYAWERHNRDLLVQRGDDIFLLGTDFVDGTEEAHRRVADLAADILTALG
ncbi:hypothetical protein AB0N73_06980 [Microbacterium sp. NPDC089189]|uniref:hypothetical protein n=1 Tax=Microbacterium sp. NPDC089189 TaxID=3154972 RepID=UPI00341CF8D0